MGKFCPKTEKARGINSKKQEAVRLNDPSYFDGFSALSWFGFLLCMNFNPIKSTRQVKCPVNFESTEPDFSNEDRVL